MSHNWLLAKPGSAERITALASKLAGEADAHARHYAPESDEVLVHTRVVDPGKSTLIRFQAPTQPGRYPYLCTLPGHAILMRGEMIVE
jgi:azurin